MTKRVTAGELLTQLEKDANFVAWRAERDRALKAKADAFEAEEAPLVTDLRAAGFDVTSVWDLVNSSRRYDEAVPFLLSHLAQPYSSPIREGIARALGAPAALREWTVLVTRYELERDARVKDGIAAALSAIADDTVINSLIALVLAPANGPSRLLLLRALAKSRDPKARDAMLKLRGDPLFEDELKALSRHSK